MHGITDLAATRQALRQLARIVAETRQMLAAMIESNRPGWRPSSRRPGQLAETLQHLEEVREGFILSQRTSPQLSLTELRALVKHILLEWDWLGPLNLAFTPAGRIEFVGQQLIAYNHAVVALAVLPHLPAEVITFPQKNLTYADLTAPSLPAELLERIEELERVIYQAEVRPTRLPAYGPFRRTYAFFEASTWLVDRHLRTLLGE
jgi:hypothetical protein